MLGKDARALLDLVVDDSYGLWEVGERLKQMHPDITVAEVIRLAQTTAMQLLQGGLVSVWSQASPGSEESPLAAEEAKAQLGERENWEWPSTSRPMVRLLATEAGEHAYFSENSQDAR